jgi:hypothetical protein
MGLGFGVRINSAPLLFSNTLAIFILCCSAPFIEGREINEITARVLVDGNKYCTGFWVTSTAVVTAAHCARTATRVSVSDESGIFYEVTNAVVHAKYKKKTLENDIAVLRTRVHKIRPPKKVYFGGVVPTMRVNGEIITTVNCPYAFHAFDFCASHQNCLNATQCDKNCVGDSGTPALTVDGMITGFVAGGPSCEKDSRTGAGPGGYVSITKHKTFIAKALLDRRSNGRSTSDSVVATSSEKKTKTFYTAVLCIASLFFFI